jgi:hypothetical protein
MNISGMIFSTLIDHPESTAQCARLGSPLYRHMYDPRPHKPSLPCRVSGFVADAVSFQVNSARLARKVVIAVFRSALRLPHSSSSQAEPPRSRIHTAYDKLSRFTGGACGHEG